jgi:hypothetical protein
MRVLKNLRARFVPHSRPAVAASAALVCAAVVVACGSSRNPQTDARGGPLLKLAQCMRAQGVPNFPDPSSTGGLFIPNDINTEAPAFRSAQRACARLAGGEGGTTGSSASRRAQLLALAKCMRSHGVPNFADPTSSPPPPSTGNAVGGNGWYLALGTPQERQSPRYKRAATTCGAGAF